MSASLGAVSAGRTTGLEGACHRVYTLMINLHCTRLAFVTKYRQELYAFNNQPFDRELCICYDVYKGDLFN
jgi:hypothetical protein